MKKIIKMIREFLVLCYADFCNMKKQEVLTIVKADEAGDPVRAAMIIKDLHEI